MFLRGLRCHFKGIRSFSCVCDDEGVDVCDKASKKNQSGSVSLNDEIQVFKEKMLVERDTRESCHITLYAEILTSIESFTLLCL